MRKWLLLLVVLFSSEVQARIITFDEHKLLQLRISSLGPTRISLREDKIRDVFFYPEKAAKVVLHNSGTVFVIPINSSPTDSATADPLYLTLLSEEGKIQDLRLRMSFMQPEPLILVTGKQFLVNKEKEKKNE